MNRASFNATPSSLLERLAAPSVVRGAVGLGFRAWARHRVAQLDRMDAARVQEQTLLGLVRRARDTQFGREHGFNRIRNVRDYQERTPLRTYEDFWRQFLAPAFPDLRDVTWPGEIPYIALSSGTTSGTTKYLPISREMLASNRRAALSSLAMFQTARPETRPFAGRMLFLGGSTDLRTLQSGLHVRAGDLSGIAAREVPDFLRAYTYPPLEIALESDWDVKLDRLARGSLDQAISLASGVPSWLLAFFDRLRQLAGRETIAQIWPSLEVVMHGGTKIDPYRKLLGEVLGSSRISLLETYPASEGFIAAEDPRHGLLRLLPDHGIFFEFVPVDELASPRPVRHTLREIEPGTEYAVVLSTCAGLWSYVIGDTVRFEGRNPPLLRFTGRTKYFLSAFGEHLISDEIERAVAQAAERVGATVVDFHVGPRFPASIGEVGRHAYLVEFAGEVRPGLEQAFAQSLDHTLSDLNEDYRAHRAGDLTLLSPEVRALPRGSFVQWMRFRGKLGGQHKVPRMDNTGRLTQELMRWLEDHAGCRRTPAPQGA